MKTLGRLDPARRIGASPLRVRHASGGVTFVLGLFLAVTAAATAAVPKTREPRWVFSLLPKSLQKNPRLELTVITEMTDAGRRRPPVSPRDPAYFELYSLGPHNLGDEIGGTEAVPANEVVELLRRALAKNGYQPAQPPAHPPSLLITYTWGMHNRLDEPDPDNPMLSPMAVERNLLDRAALVGGTKFAEELRRAFEQKNDLDLTGGALVPILDPIELFRRRQENNDFLVEQSLADVYYVVASAYDYDLARTRQRVLLWRTRMTVASAGVSEQQSLPALVTAAGPYFGKDMPQAEVLSRRSVREGSVEIGPPIIVEETAPPAPKGTK
jgi:hypothetical protein